MGLSAPSAELTGSPAALSHLDPRIEEWTLTMGERKPETDPRWVVSRFCSSLLRLRRRDQRKVQLSEPLAGKSFSGGLPCAAGVVPVLAKDNPDVGGCLGCAWVAPRATFSRVLHPCVLYVSVVLEAARVASDRIQRNGQWPDRPRRAVGRNTSTIEQGDEKRA